jgi:hypothetical protein
MPVPVITLPLAGATVKATRRRHQPLEAIPWQEVNATEFKWPSTHKCHKRHEAATTAHLILQQATQAGMALLVLALGISEVDDTKMRTMTV